MMKKQPHPVAPLLKGQTHEWSHHASIFRRQCAYCSALSLLVVVGINLSL